MLPSLLNLFKSDFRNNLSLSLFTLCEASNIFDRNSLGFFKKVVWVFELNFVPGIRLISFYTFSC